MKLKFNEKIERLLFFTVCVRPRIAKANRGGRSYTQSVVQLVIINLQQYNNIRLNTNIKYKEKKKNKMT